MSEGVEGNFERACDDNDCSLKHSKYKCKLFIKIERKT